MHWLELATPIILANYHCNSTDGDGKYSLMYVGGPCLLQFGIWQNQSHISMSVYLFPAQDDCTPFQGHLACITDMNADWLCFQLQGCW